MPIPRPRWLFRRDPAPPRPPAPRRCPTCGQENAVVFYPIHAQGSGAETQLFCLKCCPRPDDETKS